VVTGTLRRVKIQQIPWDDETPTDCAAGSLSAAPIAAPTSSDSLNPVKPPLCSGSSNQGTTVKPEPPRNTGSSQQGTGLNLQTRTSTNSSVAAAHAQDDNLKKNIENVPRKDCELSDKENVASLFISRSIPRKTKAEGTSNYVNVSRKSSSVNDDVFVRPGDSILSSRNGEIKSSALTMNSAHFLPPYPKSSLSSMGSVKPARKVKLSDDVEIIGNSPDVFESTILVDASEAKDQTLDVADTSSMDMSLVQPVLEGQGRVRGRQKGQRTIMVERSKEGETDGVDGCKTQ